MMNHKKDLNETLINLEKQVKIQIFYIIIKISKIISNYLKEFRFDGEFERSNESKQPVKDPIHKSITSKY